ncbi:MAG: flagellar biosynthesis anti-sigma factor FlgM [Treponema sp.]|jgi:negative regulator of flagellin synthesis FlgM|nr:flagellar biosynthesis anti-sigma factor FlgM [Treponema sp.]
MMIDKVGYINLIQHSKNAEWNNQVNRTVQTDSITLSAEAKEKSELYQANAVVASASDVRMDRIAELKQKINDPSYINDVIINATADRIMDIFGL